MLYPDQRFFLLFPSFVIPNAQTRTTFLMIDIHERFLLRLVLVKDP
jgi:hypothetical protein